MLVISSKINALTPAQSDRLGYFHSRVLPSGEMAGLQAMLFTTGLFVGIGPDAYQRRYCYEFTEDACSALATWNGGGDPPGPWIMEKPGDRLGPGATGEADA